MVQPRSPAHLPVKTSPVPKGPHWPLALPSVKSVVKPLAAAASFLYWCCQSRLAQSFQVVKDIVFPSQVYLRELNTFREKLEKLESEFSKLQGALQAPPVKKDGPVHITLKDLLNVKLKKTNSNLRMDKMAHPKSPSPARLSAANSFDEK
ncbi:hypothetical protein TURU_148095 [Turdus rufiventris]|nr:hypothetical protein TURU_148095 [Turdus rufiventris]